MASITRHFQSKFFQFLCPNIYRNKPSPFTVCHRNQYMFTTPNCPSEKKYEKPGFKITKVATEEGVVEVKKKLYEPRITLLSPDNSLQVITLEEANKIAHRRYLKLHKVSDRDPKTDRPVYKLLTSAEATQQLKKEKGKKSSNSKDEKLLNVNAKITEHDLESKIKHMQKWLEKEQTVKVIISGDAQNLSPAEKVFSLISAGVGDAGRVVQKVAKGGEIKFQVILPKRPKVKKDVAPTASDDESPPDKSDVK